MTYDWHLEVALQLYMPSFLQKIGVQTQKALFLNKMLQHSWLVNPLVIWVSYAKYQHHSTQLYYMPSKHMTYSQVNETQAFFTVSRMVIFPERAAIINCFKESGESSNCRIKCTKISGIPIGNVWWGSCLWVLGAIICIDALESRWTRILSLFHPKNGNNNIPSLETILAKSAKWAVIMQNEYLWE